MSLASEVNIPAEASAVAPVKAGKLWSQMRRAAVPVAIVVIWQLASSSNLISQVSFPAPLSIISSFWSLTVSGELPQHLAVSFARAFSGLAIGVLIGSLLALISGLSLRGEEAVDSTIQMLRTIPHLAVVPLFILWFGIGETPKVTLVAMGVTFIIYINLFAGIRGVDAKIVEAGRTLGLTRSEMIRYIILPGALPSFLVGLRYAMGSAWLSLVVGEQVNATSGIGHLVMNAREFMQTEIIFVGLVIYALLGLSTDMIVRAIDRAAFKWRPTFVKS